jgi:Mg2+ and Co2+ transporter CorA
MSEFIKVSDLQEFLQGIVERNRLKDMADNSQTEQPKLTLTEIVGDGKQKMVDAVECVIAKHEKELKAIDNKIKLESKSALASIGRYGNCHDSMHSLMMAVMRSDAHSQYLDYKLGCYGLGNSQLQAQGSMGMAYNSFGASLYGKG